MRNAGATKTGRRMTANNDRSTKPQELPEITIGKDVLELVSSAMYIDPMTVYREYIQNAADAVDAARTDGTLSEDESGRVDISVDPEMRTVKIRDNGCGLPFQDFRRELTALGGSRKRGTSTRGFRGVGRLGGLAYAQELIFRSRRPGENEVSQLRWDCRQLKAALREPPYDVSVADLIRQVTTLERTEVADAPERFFEVEMRGIIRLKSDRLISPLAISEYLSQVAPVPFSHAFRFGAEISQALSGHVDLGELEIRVTGTDEPIYRPHRDSLNVGGNPTLTFKDLTVIEVPGLDDGVSAIAWILHHEYSGAVPTGTLLKGLRLRTGNIQVGGHALLEGLFSEPRFNSWSVGEVHVVDRRIVPNSRRDHFEQTGHFHNLLNHLAPTARDISRRCRTNSVRRKWERQFELCAHSTADTISIIVQKSTNQEKRQQLALSAEQTLLQMDSIAKKDLLANTAYDLHHRIREFREQLRTAMNEDVVVSSPLMRLSESERRLYEGFFGLIYECSTNRTAAKALIDRILLKIEYPVLQKPKWRDETGIT